MEKVAEVVLEDATGNEMPLRHSALKSAFRRAEAAGKSAKAVIKLAGGESDSGDRNAVGTMLYDSDNADAAFSRAFDALQALSKVFHDVKVSVAVYMQ